MNAQATPARAQLRTAEAGWKNHLQHCPLCGRAARARKWDQLCPAGARRREQASQARAALAREQETGKLPAADQEMLW